MSPDSSICADLLQGVDTVLDSLRKQPRPPRRTPGSAARPTAASAATALHNLDAVFSPAHRRRSATQLRLQLCPAASTQAPSSSPATGSHGCPPAKALTAAAVGAYGGGGDGGQAPAWSGAVSGRLAGFVGHRLLARELKGATPEAVRRWSIDRSPPPLPFPLLLSTRHSCEWLDFPNRVPLQPALRQPAAVFPCLPPFPCHKVWISSGRVRCRAGGVVGGGQPGGHEPRVGGCGGAGRRRGLRPGARCGDLPVRARPTAREAQSGHAKPPPPAHARGNRIAHAKGARARVHDGAVRRGGGGHRRP